MKTNSFAADLSGSRTYLFGSFSVGRGDGRGMPSMKFHFGRLTLVVGAMVLLSYVAFVSAGYIWLHHVRKVQEVRVVDVALFRWKQVRREIAAKHFEKAREAWEARDFGTVFVSLNSGLRNDPDNIPGRLMGAGYFQAAGISENAVRLLEEGLLRFPDDERLIERTFDLLTSSGRDRRALELLHGKLEPMLAGQKGSLLRMYELLATLNADGPLAGRRLLEKYPELRKTDRALLVVGRVLWEVGEKLDALEIVSSYVSSHADVYAGYSQLSAYQQAFGLVDEGRRTAQRACEKFPKEPSPRLLLLATLEPTRSDLVVAWKKEIASYLKDFGDRPEDLILLASLAGRAGWFELARLIYEQRLSRGGDARSLALACGDALIVQRRFPEAIALLTEIGLQTRDDEPLSPLLLQRQILAAAGAGQSETTRSYARRLASALKGDSGQLALMRMRFERLGITEAAAEFSSQSQMAKPVGKKAKPG
jgi:tetratricopeptide (TPR) repeat protein